MTAGRADQFRSHSSSCSGDLRWNLYLLLWPRDQETEFPVEACWLSQTQGGQTEQTHPQTFDDLFFFDSTDMVYMGSHLTDSQQGILCWGLRELRKRFRQKRPALFKSGQWHFHQDNAPVHNSILVTDYLSKIGFKTVPQPPYSPDLATCDFWWRCPWRSRYRRRKWTRRYEFKSWTRLIAFHIALIPLGKVWIQLFSLQLWVNSRTD